MVFDLDGTLLRGTSVSRLAEQMGRVAEIAALERRYTAGEITNAKLARTSAGWFADRRPADLWTALESACWIDGIQETVHALRAADSALLLATITWRFAAELVARHYDFDAACGTEMAIDSAGHLLGEVSRLFDEYDKAEFIESWCARRGVPMTQAAAVGDSRSDVPLFHKVGLAIDPERHRSRARRGRRGGRQRTTYVTCRRLFTGQD